ncbi:hypothetical protein BRADI_3g13196v3 [Brachypodium distachyon]|uniref:Uncharacterized protein n=1 Tax=Brachypodium distachyon TaxID=15368 RepID=A0A2K2CWV0_BRADI|nr:hypothetical protein BRADI_3g13196v3 [Brachypodium distachyon]
MHGNCKVASLLQTIAFLQDLISISFPVTSPCSCYAAIVAYDLGHPCISPSCSSARLPNCWLCWLLSGDREGEYAPCCPKGKRKINCIHGVQEKEKDRNEGKLYNFNTAAIQLYKRRSRDSDIELDHGPFGICSDMEVVNKLNRFIKNQQGTSKGPDTEELNKKQDKPGERTAQQSCRR